MLVLIKFTLIVYRNRKIRLKEYFLNIISSAHTRACILMRRMLLFSLMLLSYTTGIRKQSKKKNKVKKIKLFLNVHGTNTKVIQNVLTLFLLSFLFIFKERKK